MTAGEVYISPAVASVVVEGFLHGPSGPQRQGGRASGGSAFAALSPFALRALFQRLLMREEGGRRRAEPL